MKVVLSSIWSLSESGLTTNQKLLRKLLFPDSAKSIQISARKSRVDLKLYHSQVNFSKAKSKLITRLESNSDVMIQQLCYHKAKRSTMIVVCCLREKVLSQAINLKKGSKSPTRN